MLVTSEIKFSLIVGNFLLTVYKTPVLQSIQAFRIMTMFNISTLIYLVCLSQCPNLTFKRVDLSFFITGKKMLSLQFCSSAKVHTVHGNSNTLSNS